jgi:hypothetical protein
MATYEWRGAKMLSQSSYKGKRFQCAWASMSAVEIEYIWGVSKKYRFESFCYGPKSCKLYKMGKPRAVLSAVNSFEPFSVTRIEPLFENYLTITTK